MHSLRSTLFWLIALPLTLWATACGSILSSSEISAASTALEQAEAASAEELALYEFVSAQEYLGKARAEWGRSDFQQAVDYARRAQSFAVLAYERARRAVNIGTTTAVLDDD